MKKHTPLLEKLFVKNYQLIDGTDEIFELDLALWEYEVLSKEEYCGLSHLNPRIKESICPIMGFLAPEPF